MFEPKILDALYKAAAAAFGELGLAAALITKTGQAVAVNALFESSGDPFVHAAFRRIEFKAAASDRIFRSTLEKLATGKRAGIRSIAVPATEASPVKVAHLVPIRGAANDLFSSVDAILLVTPVVKDRLPSADLLHGLFDLTPAEAGLSRALLGGESLGQIAKARGVSIETARSQLKSVFSKTATKRQSTLIALLSGLSPPFR